MRKNANCFLCTAVAFGEQRCYARDDQERLLPLSRDDIEIANEIVREMGRFTQFCSDYTHADLNFRILDHVKGTITL